MRISLAALAGIFMLFSGPLVAEEFPWCVEADVFTKNCAFASRVECLAVAKNLASPATGPGRCIANPNYQPPSSTKTSARPPDKSKPR